MDFNHPTRIGERIQDVEAEMNGYDHKLHSGWGQRHEAGGSAD